MTTGERIVQAWNLWWRDKEVGVDDGPTHEIADADLARRIDAALAEQAALLERLVNAVTPLIGEPCPVCHDARPNHRDDCALLLAFRALPARRGE